MVEYQAFNIIDDFDDISSSNSNVNISTDDFGFSKPSFEEKGKSVKLKTNFLKGYSKREVDELIQKIEDDQGKIQNNLQQQLKDLFREYSNLTSECNVLREQLSNSDAQISDIDQTKKMLQETMSENELLSANLDKKKEQCHILEKYAQEMEDKYAAIQNEINSTDNQDESQYIELFKQLELNCKDMEQQLNQAQTENIELHEKLIEIQNQDSNSQAQEQLSALEDENQKLKDILQQHSEVFEKAKEQIEKLHNKLQQYEEIISQMENNQKLYEQTNTQLDDLKSKYIEAQNNNQLLEDEIIRINQIASKQSEKINQYHNINDDYQFLNQKCITQEEKICALEDEKNVLLNDIHALDNVRSEYNSLHNKFLQVTQNLDLKNSQVKDIELVVDKYQQQEKKYIVLENENQNYHQEMLAMGNTVQEILKQMEIQTNTYDYFVNQFDNCKKQLNTTIKDKTDLQVKNIDLAEQISQLSERLELERKEKVQIQQRLNEYRIKIHGCDEESCLCENQNHEDGSQDVDFKRTQVYFFLEDAQKKAQKLADLGFNANQS